MERDRISALVGTLALATGVLAGATCSPVTAKQIIQPSQTMFIAENKASGEKGKEMSCGKGSCGTDAKGAAAAKKKRAASSKSETVAKSTEKKTVSTTDKTVKTKK